MKLFLAHPIIILLISVSISVNGFAQQDTQILLASDVKWQPLNPARGEKGPRAGVLWGDLRAEVPTGFLAKFTDGFSSPPHVHNITYRAVVINGEVHNDDPDALPMWMSPGSFWTQPKGEIHITAAKGKNTIALVEIDHGPYLVLPVEKKFDSGIKPVNVDSSNLVWVDYPGTAFTDGTPQVAYLWEDSESRGSFVKLPTGFSGKILFNSGYFHGVIVKGKPRYSANEKEYMDPGSYFGSKGQAVHEISSHENTETVIYVRTNSQFRIIGN